MKSMLKSMLCGWCMLKSMFLQFAYIATFAGLQSDVRLHVNPYENSLIFIENV